MVKVKELNDLLRRAFVLACEMFGEKNVDLDPLDFIVIYPSSTNRGLRDRILVSSSNPSEVASGVVSVLSPKYFDKAMKFADIYELEVIGRKDGVILRKQYA